MNEIITIGVFLIGYYLGSKRSVKDDVHTLSTKIKKDIAAPFQEELKPGIIKRPSAQDLVKLRQDPRHAEEERAMVKTLDAIPELYAAKEYVQKHPDIVK